MTKDLLPLREPTFFILLSISTEKKHGYAILQEVEALSEGKIRLSNGTLYGALTRLQDQGLIERVASDDAQTSGAQTSDAQTSGKPRKAYRITRTGLVVLHAEVARLGALVQTARQHLPEGT